MARVTEAACPAPATGTSAGRRARDACSWAIALATCLGFPAAFADARREAPTAAEGTGVPQTPAMICERLRSAATERCRPVARLDGNARDGRVARPRPVAAMGEGTPSPAR